MNQLTSVYTRKIGGSSPSPGMWMYTKLSDRISWFIESPVLPYNHRGE